MSRQSRLFLTFLVSILFVFSALAQEAPEQTQQVADDEIQKLMQEMGVSGEEGEVDMEALQKMMQENMGSMFEQVEVPVGPYENTDYGYTFVVPEGWSGAYVFGVLSVVKGDVADMMSQMEMAQPTMMIMAIPPEEVDGDFDIENADLAMIKAEMEAAAEDGVEISVLEVKRTKVEGHTAIYTELIQKINMQMEGMPPIQAEVQSSVYMFEANGHRFNLMFAAPTGSWSEYKGFFKDQLQNFKLKK